MADKAELLIGGGGFPSLDELAAMFRKLTGKDPDPADLERTRARMEKEAKTAKYSPDQPRVPSGDPAGGQFAPASGGGESSSEKPDDEATDEERERAKEKV